MKLKLFLFFFLFTSITIFSQKKNIIISGKITDSLSTVKNAHIINLKNRQGTFSSDDGTFRIFVSIGDSLQISSIQHITKKIVIDEKIIADKTINIKLVATTYVLDEFDLKRHNLFGRLGIDINDVPNNRKDSLLRRTMDFSKVNMKLVEADDYIDKRVRPPINNTDPTAAFAGAGATAIMPFRYSEKLWALRKELARKKAFPYKIMSELGEKFFFEELKIPIEKYFHFLDYCNPLGIEKLHKEKNLLEIIKIFRQESIDYLKIIKKE